jgi:hypothetical protein
MTIEAVISDLTTQTTSLLDTCVSLRDGVSQLISDSVVESENKAIEPLFVVSTNLINTQALLITLLNR